MTGAEKIIERIAAEAREKAEKIRKDAREKADGIVKKANTEAHDQEKKIIEKARVDAQERRRRMRTVAELDMRKNILSVKQEMIEEAFNKVLDKLQDIPKEEYQNIVYELLMDGVQTGEEQIIISTRDEEKFTQDFIDRVNQGLESKIGRLGNVRLAEERRNLRGGFILRAGGVEINSSFESILRMERDEIEPEVASALFGK